jgi:lipopolysaccharide biosynthesis protein
VRIAQNRGRDIAPKLISCRDVYDNYEYILHVHTKKSPHRGHENGWRSFLLDTLIGTPKTVDSVFEAFRTNPRLGMIAPQHLEDIRPYVGWGWNFEIARQFGQRLGIPLSLDGAVDFPSGSMFWARSAALKPCWILI